MLQSIDQTPIEDMVREADFAVITGLLGDATANAIRQYLDGVIDGLPLDNRGLRTLDTTRLGADLAPWPQPLAEVYRRSQQFMGPHANAQEVEHRAALWFGQFVWERMLHRNELWTVWDPNLNRRDPNREPVGKVYFEQGR